MSSPRKAISERRTKAIVRQLAVLLREHTPEQRLAIFDELFLMEFCRYCGRERDGRACHCMNDD